MIQRKHFTDQNVDLEQLSGILDCLVEGVLTVDSQKNINFFNREAERITGFRVEEAIGQPCCDIFCAEVCGEGCLLEAAIEKRETITDHRINIIDRNGHSATLSINARSLRGESGDRKGGITTFRDVTNEEALRRQIENSHNFNDIVSCHPQMHKTFALLPNLAASDLPTLIEGANGTGKSLLGNVIHNLSNRQEGQYITVNCALLPEALLESELFGSKKRHAHGGRDGAFALAENGTLLLDEIGDLSPAMQVRVLRVLQKKAYVPLGSTEPETTNARIVATTSQPLDALVQDGSFRQDLYYRLNVLSLEFPPLKERLCDIPLLVEHFRRRLNAEKGNHIENVATEVFDVLMRHDFPGNIRELKNIIHHAFVLCKGNKIQCEHLPHYLLGITEFENIEKSVISSALRDHNGNRSAVARRLGIDTGTLFLKMRHFGLE
ncbi:MAG: sigma 54-interacting transcriptional regulator [Lentisphaeria bacterium]